MLACVNRAGLVVELKLSALRRKCSARRCRLTLLPKPAVAISAGS